MDGTAEERHLVNCLDALGWEGVRAPARGTAPRNQPDFLMAKDGIVLNGELKAGGPPKNIDAQEVADLRTFGVAFEAADVIGTRYKGDRTFYLTDVDLMPRTNSGKFSTRTTPNSIPWGVALEFDIQKVDGETVYDVDVALADHHVTNLNDVLLDWVRHVRRNQRGGGGDG